MKWYLAKIIYRIVSGEGHHTPQFDEQLRLIHAEDDMQAFQKARSIGEKEEDTFLNNYLKPVHWKFLDITELHPLEELTDGAEIYSRIDENEDPLPFINQIKMRAQYLQEVCYRKTFEMN